MGHKPCLSSFSVAPIRHYDQSNLSESLFQACSSRGLESMTTMVMEHGSGHAGRHGAGPVAENTHPETSMEQRES